jgi:cell division initiation protein
VKITPLDIRNQEFKRIMRGYDPVEVNTYLEMLSNELESVIREQKSNRERILELETQLRDYKQIEKSLQQALLQAQESASRAREQSNQEAEIIIKQAEVRAGEIVHESRNSLSRLRNEIEQLNTTRETMVSRLKILLNSQIELLRSLESEHAAESEGSAKVTVGKKSVDIDDILEKMDKEP